MAQQDLRVNIKGDASGLTTALGRAQGKLKSFGSKMSSIGSSLQTRLALPLLAIGGASTKMALDFDKSMTKIKTLVGIASDEVDAMGAKVKQMARETGVGSTEAADALFFITSAGLRGSEALDTLNVSLKAAAIGLGETETIASLNTAAMAAYGKEVLSTTDATDILVAAVREGRLDASQLADSMEQVVPIASEMGVSFAELSAAFASVSRTNKNASEAATGLKNIMVSLLNPSTQAREELERLGLSADIIRQNIKSKGLLNTLQLLTNKFDGNADSTTAVFGNVRALLPVMSLTGAQAAEVQGIFDRMNNTLGESEKSFSKLGESAEFKFRKAVNGAKETLVDLGEKLLVEVVPIVQKLSNFIQGLYNAFKNLEPSTQNIVIALGGFAIVLPTIITLFGGLLSAVGAILSPIGLVVAALAGVAYVVYKNWGEVLPVVAGLYNQFVDLYNGSETLRKAIWIMGATFKSVFIGVKVQIDQFVNVFKTMWKLIKAFSEDGFDAAFGDIMEEGVYNAKQIMADGTEDIAKAFTDAWEGAAGHKLEKKTAEQLQQSINNGIDGVQDYIKGLANQLGFTIGSGVAEGIEEGAYQVGGVLPDIVLNASNATNFDQLKEKITEWQKWALANADSFNQQLSGILQTGMTNLVGGFAEIIGKGIAEGGNMAGQMGELLLTTIADLLKQLGYAIIQIGFSMLALQAAFTNPFAAIAAGAGLVALGAMMGSMIPTILGKTSSSGQNMEDRLNAPTIGGIPAFANGGIVSGPTLGLMGEYPGARSNPEVIAPLNKLQSLIGGGRGQNVNVGGEFVMRGSDLVVVLERANKNKSRLI